MDRVASTAGQRLVVLRGEHAKDASDIFTTNTDLVAETFYAVAAETA